jgi:hypothetical protein
VIATRERCAHAGAIVAPTESSSSSPAAPDRFATHASVLPPIGDQATRLLNILAGLPAEDRALFEPWLPAWLRRRRDLDARNAALRALAAGHLDSTGWRIALRLHRELTRYVDRGGFGRDRHRGQSPDDPRRAMMFRAVQLHRGGKAPSRNTIWLALAGRRGPAQKLLRE